MGARKIGRLKNGRLEESIRSRLLELMTPVNESACARTTIDRMQTPADGAAPLRIASMTG
jgi:hypothetical protein